MDNSGIFWTKIEEEQLINEYNTNQLSIDEISIIHKRNIGGISARLVKLKIIEERKLARRSNTNNNILPKINYKKELEERIIKLEEFIISLTERINKLES